MKYLAIETSIGEGQRVAVDQGSHELAAPDAGRSTNLEHVAKVGSDFYG